MGKNLNTGYFAEKATVSQEVDGRRGVSAGGIQFLLGRAAVAWFTVGQSHTSVRRRGSEARQGEWDLRPMPSPRQPGPGTTFTDYLPCARPVASGLPAETSALGKDIAKIN